MSRMLPGRSSQSSEAERTDIGLRQPHCRRSRALRRLAEFLTDEPRALTAVDHHEMIVVFTNDSSASYREEIKPISLFYEQILPAVEDGR